MLLSLLRPALFALAILPVHASALPLLGGPKAISAADAAELSGKTLVVATHEPRQLQIITPARALPAAAGNTVTGFGMGALKGMADNAARSDGAQTAAEHALSDPGVQVGLSLARHIAEAYGVKVADAPVQVAGTRRADVLAAGGDTVLDVQTKTWMLGYMGGLPTNWKNYGVFLTVEATLLDSKGRKLASSDCTRQPTADDVRTREEFFADDGALLKQALAVAVESCSSELKDWMLRTP